MYQEVRNEKKVNVRKFFEIKSIIVYLLSILIGFIKMPSGATPFGIALLGAFADTGFPLIIPLALIGISTGVAFGWTCFLKFLIASILFITMKSFIKGNTKTGNAAKMLFSTAISELVILMASQTIIYDGIMAAFMSTTTAIFYLIFSEGLPIILDYDKKKITTHETMMAAGILITILLTCLGDFNVCGLNVRNIICILIVLYLGWRRGTTCGIVSGVSVSLVLGIMGYASASTVATFAVCGLLAGVLSRFGKIGAVIGFALGNAIWVYYINASTEIIIPIGEIIIASVILFFLPKRVVSFIDDLFEFENALEGKDPIALLAESTIFKLKSVSDVANDMANNVENEAKKFNDDMSQFVKNIKEGTCSKCDNYKECWNKNYHSTYENIFNAIDVLKKNNVIEESDIELDFCDRKEVFIEGLNNAYDIYKIDNDWKNKVKEDRKLVAKQLRGVSKAIDNVQGEIKEMNQTANNIEFLGIGLKLDFASSKKTMTSSNESGDSTTYVKLKNGKVLFGISDGMGSGESAASSSKKVLEVFEKYLNAGLEKHVAIDLMNSYMMIGEHEDRYATLDTVIFDEATGDAEMIKFGACPTYIMKDGNVKMISSKSLPIGSTMNVDAEIYKEKFDRNTLIVMISDGVIEANKMKEKWITQLLKSLKTDNPKRIADIILQEAIDENFGTAKDDMSVVVVKVC